jgi:sodium transport system permease protein
VVPAPVNIKAVVRAEKANNILVVPEYFTTLFNAKKTAAVELIVNSSQLPGLIALNRTLGWLGEYNQTVWGKRISAHGVDFQKLRPLPIKNTNVSSGTHIAEVLLFMVPALFIFNLFMGGVYLAMDTTSGERERDSLEPLLINPIERWGLMLGKFLAARLFITAALAVKLVAFQIAFKLAGVGSFSFVHNLSALTIVGIMLMTQPSRFPWQRRQCWRAGCFVSWPNFTNGKS